MDVGYFGSLECHRRGRDGRSGVGVGESRTPFYGGASWSNKNPWVVIRCLPSSSCPCPSSAATATASASSPKTGTSGEDPYSAVKMGYVLLPICGIGLVICPTFSSGLLPLRGSRCPASRGLCLRRQTLWFRRCNGYHPSLLAYSFIVESI